MRKGGRHGELAFARAKILEYLARLTPNKYIKFMIIIEIRKLAHESIK